MGKKNTDKKRNKQRKRQMESEKAQRTHHLMGWTLAVILAAFVAAIIFGLVSGSHSAEESNKPVDESVFRYAEQPMMGAQDAPVRIVEFADFKCPVCKRFDETILPQLKKDFIDSGMARLYMINYPIISPEEDSRTAAMAGEAVYHQNAGEFWKFFEAVFARQGDEKTRWATSDALTQIARQSGVQVDYDKMKKDIDDDAFAKDVENDQAIVRKLGLNSTPTIFINGKLIANSDAFDYDALKALIQQAKDEDGK